MEGLIRNLVRLGFEPNAAVRDQLGQILRAINLVFEAFRQLGFPGEIEPDSPPGREAAPFPG